MEQKLSVEELEDMVHALDMEVRVLKDQLSEADTLNYATQQKLLAILKTLIVDQFTNGEAGYIYIKKNLCIAMGWKYEY